MRALFMHNAVIAKFLKINRHMNILKVALIMLAFVAFQVHASDGRNLSVSSNGASNRFALVIGNDTYQHVDPLEKAANDARAMGRALELAHFQTKVVVNASRTQMNMAINRFVNDVKGGGVGVFFFAGHGVQLNNQNFLIPVDLQDIQSEADIADQGVSLQGLQDKLAEARAKFSLLVVDACRNNPLPKMAGRSLGGTRGLSQASSAEGQIVVFSAGANQQALDKLSSSDTNPNGVFTREFLPLLSKPGVTIRDAVLQVRSSVRARAKSVDHEQFPAIYDQAEGDFYFVEGSGTQVASLVPVAVTPQPVAHIKTRDEIEQDTWEGVRDSNNAGAVAEYLKQYPKGRLIATLKGGGGARPVEPVTPVAVNSGRSDGESDLWAEVQKGNSRDDYDAYLAQYPKGKFVALARSRIVKLQEAAAAEADRREQEAWESAEGTSSEDAYRSYLKGWPSGKYTGLAQVRIRKLQSDLAARAEQELWQKAESSQSSQTVQAYLDRYPNGSHVASAQNMLAAIKKAESSGPAMVRIPAGSIQIGSSKDTDNPVRMVSVQAFEIGKYAVTQKEWRDVMGNNPSKFTSCGDNCPVEQVSWDDIQIFLQKLNAKTGRQYRLPNETEWEYACYGGSTSEYCGSNDINAVAWYNENSNSTTHPVGQKQANGYGLYDMSGNVWQWMENCYSSSCSGRALRGGSWNYGLPDVRAALRYFNVPAKRSGSGGFRVARTLP
jgi:formylglycine-generating enzyme required for sulfatase activity